MGATDRFVRRPFLYSGFWYGAIGGFLALLVVQGVTFWIEKPLSALVALYGVEYLAISPSFTYILLLMVLSIGLGVIGAWLAVARHLRTMEPE